MKVTLEGVELALEGDVFDAELVLNGSAFDALQHIFLKEYVATMADAFALSLHPETLMQVTHELAEKVPYSTLGIAERTVGIQLASIVSYATGTLVKITRDARLLWTEADIVWKR